MNGAIGMSDIEGKAAWVAAREAGAERVSTQIFTDSESNLLQNSDLCFIRVNRWLNLSGLTD